MHNEILFLFYYSGEETAEMLEPHKKSIALLGLGTSVGTSNEGITAPVLVVTSFADLAAKQDQVLHFCNTLGCFVNDNGN